jgi:hypothetical protein
MHGACHRPERVPGCSNVRGMMVCQGILQRRVRCLPLRNGLGNPCNWIIERWDGNSHADCRDDLYPEKQFTNQRMLAAALKAFNFAD